MSLSVHWLTNFAVSGSNVRSHGENRMRHWQMIANREPYKDREWCKCSCQRLYVKRSSTLTWLGLGSSSRPCLEVKAQRVPQRKHMREPQRESGNDFILMKNCTGSAPLRGIRVAVSWLEKLYKKAWGTRAELQSPQSPQRVAESPRCLATQQVS